MDYSKTVNLPVTDFPMKANLPAREPELLKKWEAGNIYNAIIKSRADAPLYILHDGPPYANGNIHLGHALNKILKDIIIKHKTMMGYKTPYVPGWDCHGLPIEHSVNKKLGSKAETMPKTEIRKQCREFADSFVKIQMQEFKRLGVFGDYEHPYKTMSMDYESKILETFGEIFEQGFIYRNKKPIYWCPTCITALAEAEVEYADHVSPSIYVKFPVDPKTVHIDGVDAQSLFVVIWTTTPWTLPANLAVCFHPDYQYMVYKFGKEYYILAKGLIYQFEEVIGSTHEQEISLSIEQLKQLKAYHPFIKRESKIIFGPHVTLEQGTGIVHTAPGHGHEDYIIGLDYNLDVFCPVDEKGLFNDDFPEMKGMFVFDANKPVVDLLVRHNMLIKSIDISHSYPHCWRCKNPLIYRATEQWFMKIDHNDMRKLAIDSVNNIEWIPSWGESRFLSMVESRPDWCLSRQRSWGVPIPSFKCNKCNTNMMTADTIKFFAQIAKMQSIDSWYDKPVGELIPPGTICSCGSTDFEKEYDILDVWFDSGVSHFAVLDVWPDHRWPADLYLEGSDQHRGWFQSSLWPALALRKTPPYKTVLTHGFMLDEQSKAMSKSEGNVIPPDAIIKEFGADILRLWVSSEDYRNDVRIGMDMLRQISDSYRKIRNTFKFIIGNISDFNEQKAVPYDTLSDIDKWLLHKLFVVTERVIGHYDAFEFHQVYRRILNFCAVDLSSLYFDISKDILYIEHADSRIRRSTQTVLNEVFKTLSTLVAPLLVFTSEEIWAFTGHDGSVHEQKYHLPSKVFENPSLADKMESLMHIKEDVLKALEIARKEKTIKSSLEADVTILIKDPSVKERVINMGSEITRFLQVSKVAFGDQKNDGMIDGLESSVAIVRTDGKKCVRCWNYFSVIGNDPNHPELCDRCTTIIKDIGK